MGPLAWIVSFIRADTPIAELDPFRRAGADAYTLIDQAPPACWMRLAAWNAYILQIYGDNLMSSCGSPRYIPTDTATVVRRIYSLVADWLECARELEASSANTLEFHLPSPLPHWHTPLRTREELAGIRSTLEAARMRVASDLETFKGSDAARGGLRTRLAGIDSTIGTVDSLWSGKHSLELSAAISDALETGLERVNELGQLLAQPSLIVNPLPSRGLRSGDSALG